MAVGDVIQHRVGQTEVGDAVAHHAADLVLGIEDGDPVAVAGQDDGNGEARGACSDDGHPAAVEGRGALHHLVGIGGGDIVFDDGEVHRHILDAPDAVPLALFLVVADQRADGGEGVVLKEHPAGLVELAVLQEPDDLRDIGVDGAALPAAGLLAAETAVGLFHYMQRHIVSSNRSDIVCPGQFPDRIIIRF